MIGFKVDQAKGLFFDADKVLKAERRAERRWMSRFGAFVRTASRSSIRTRKAVSAPGQPPTNRTGILKRFILFFYDAARRSVIIGPAKTNQVFFGPDGRPVTGTVPEILEEGGAIRVLEVYDLIAERKGKNSTKFRKGWKRADLRSRRRLAGKPMRLRKATIAARPYMGPAFEKEKQSLPKLIADSLH